jgi:hypothetical protein
MKPYKPFTTEQIDHFDYPEGVTAGAYTDALEEQARRANALLGMVEHALELGYLGEGSTANWAQRLVAEYKGEQHAD